MLQQTPTVLLFDLVICTICLQFDNFVDAAADSSSDVDDNDAEKEEEENEEDFLPTSGYMASFASGTFASSLLWLASFTYRYLQLNVIQ